jgi:hypothetical protein
MSFQTPIGSRLVVLPQHRDDAAVGFGLDDALDEGAGLDDVAALVDIAEGRGIAFELAGVADALGVER